MKYSLSVLVLLQLLLPGRAITQEILQTFPRKDFLMAFSVPDTTGFYSIRQGTYVFSVEHRSDDLKVTASLQLDGEMLGGMRVMGFLPMLDQLIVLGIDQTVERNVIQMKALTVNLRTLEVAQGVTALLPVRGRLQMESFASFLEDLLPVMSSHSGAGQSFLHVDVSPDRSKFAILFEHQNLDHTRNKTHLQVYDRDLNFLSEYNKSGFVPDQKIKINDLLVANNGDVFMSGESIPDSIIHLQGDLQQASIIAVYDGGVKIQNIALPAKDRKVLDPQLFLDFQGNLICTGFYQEPSRTGTTTQGLFHLALSKDSRAIYSKRFTPFDDRFKLKHYNESGQARALASLQTAERKSSWELEMITLVNYGEEGCMVIAEEKYRDNAAGTKFGSGSRVLGDVVLLSVNAFGVLEWAQKIPKRQLYSQKGEFASVAVGVGEEYIHLLVNEHQESELSSKHSFPRMNRNQIKSSIVGIAVSSNGEWTKTRLKTGQMGVFIEPGEYYPLQWKDYMLVQGKVGGISRTFKFMLD